jgi:hypothetical protein
MNDFPKKIPTDRDFKKFMTQVGMEEKARLRSDRPTGYSLLFKIGLILLAVLALIWTCLQRFGSFGTAWDWCSALFRNLQ